VKNFTLDIDELQGRLSYHLPGWEAQKNIAPTGRVHIPPADMVPIESAVLLLLVKNSADYEIVFIQRTEDDGPHSGQISFPGGRREPHDKTLLDTALREATEEIALKCNHLKVLGQLTPLYVPTSNFMIYPFIGFADGCDHFRPQPDEVQKVIRVRLNDILDRNHRRIEVFTSSAGDSYKAPAYFIEEVRIWGATAMIVSEFCEIISSLDRENR